MKCTDCDKVISRHAKRCTCVTRAACKGLQSKRTKRPRNCTDCDKPVTECAERCRSCAYRVGYKNKTPEELLAYKAKRAAQSKARRVRGGAKWREQHRVASAKWRAVNSERVREHKFKLNLRTNYGLTVTAYSALLQSQSGVCALCGRPETALRKGRVKRLAVDHDHSTGKVRALLCTKCNVGLGAFDDSVELLQQAIEYLKRFL